MYNLLLVDDEATILEGLSHNIDWTRLDIQEVFTAKNTPCAMEILHGHRIDLVITDIQMPGEDGLTLGEAILHNHPYTKVIILSGYQSFTYAQRSINIKAFRYLLKPIRYEELEGVVTEALRELQLELQKKAALERARKQALQAVPVFRRQYLASWLEKDTAHPWEDRSEVEEYGLHIAPGDYGFFVMIRLGQQAKGISQEELYHYVMLELCKDMLLEENRMTHFLNSQQIHCFLFLMDGPEEEASTGEPAAIRSFFHRTVERLEWVLCSLENLMAGPIRIFWSFPHPLKELGECYRELNRKLLRFSGNSQNLVCGPEMLEHSSAAQEPASLHSHPSFPTRVATGQAQAALDWIDRVFQELSQQTSNCHDQCLHIYHIVIGTLIADSFQRGIGISDWGENFLDFLEEMGAAVVEELHGRCRAITAQYMEHLSNRQKNQEDRLIGQIKQYIRDNSAERVSLSRLAAHFCYNATYLSRVFKTKTGVLLTDYIIQVKMDKAQELLRAGTLPTDAAAVMGYDTYSHFSRTFKRVVGVSPKQYQDGSEEPAT